MLSRLMRADCLHQISEGGKIDRKVLRQEPQVLVLCDRSIEVNEWNEFMAMYERFDRRSICRGVCAMRLVQAD